GKRAGAGATVRAARCVPVAVWRGPRESPHAERLSRRVWGGARCAPDAGVGGDAASRVGAARASDPGWHAGPCECGGGVVPARGNLTAVCGGRPRAGRGGEGGECGDGSRATDPDACGGGATHWPAAARVSGGWRLRAVGKYCRRGGRRRDGVCAGAETAPGRHRSTRGEADRRARGGRLARAHGDRGREDDLQGPSGGGGNGERGSPSTPGTQSPAGARLG